MTDRRWGLMGRLLLIALLATLAPAASAAVSATSAMVTHYYQSILRRAPDSGGQAFWEGEAGRMTSLGASINETWYAMAMSFYFSPEYVGLKRTDDDFVADLYETFFNRTPDQGGLAYW